MFGLPTKQHWRPKKRAKSSFRMFRRGRRVDWMVYLLANYLLPRHNEAMPLQAEDQRIKHLESTGVAALQLMEIGFGDDGRSAVLTRRRFVRIIQHKISRHLEGSKRRGKQRRSSLLKEHSRRLSDGCTRSGAVALKYMSRACSHHSTARDQKLLEDMCDGH